MESSALLWRADLQVSQYHCEAANFEDRQSIMASSAVAATQQSQQQLPPAVQYREILAECQQLMQKIAELEVDRNEHILVEDTLKPLDGSRRAYRLVGDVLVERTIKEVLPSVTTNKDNVRASDSGIVSEVLGPIGHLTFCLVLFCSFF